MDERTRAAAVGASAPERVDRRLRAFVLGAVRWRLALGEAFERLGCAGGVRALGFSSTGAYAVERCGFSGRWVEEARGLARRLAGLPGLRAALVAGRVTWSMAQLVARHATSESEGELVAAACGATVRAMRATLEPRGDWRRDPDEAPPRRTIETVVDAEDAWAFERARLLVEAVTGEKNNDVIVEAMLAETLTSILPTTGSDGGEALLTGLERAADGARWAAEGQRVQAMADDKLAAAFEPLAAPRDDVTGDVAEVEVATDDDPAAIDRTIVKAAGELRSRDLAIGRLVRFVFETGMWRALGYATFDHFVRERLGMSRAAVQSKMALVRRCEALPELGEALRDGRIGTTSAMMIGRIADPETARAWVERAAERTVKHLREEVEAVGLVARTSGARGAMAPPDEATVAAVQAVERAVLAGEPAAPIQMSVAPDEGPRPRTGRVPLRLTVASDVADLWMAVRAMYSERGGREATPSEATGVTRATGARPENSERGGRAATPSEATGVTRATGARPENSERGGREATPSEATGVTRAEGARPENSRRGAARSFVAALSDNIVRYWTPEVVPDRPFEDVYRRDRYRCASPTCDRREVGAHHIVFRAHGGSDEAGNLVSLCGRCHVEGVHAGSIRVVGRAPDRLQWELGPVTVAGRVHARPVG